MIQPKMDWQPSRAAPRAVTGVLVKYRMRFEGGRMDRSHIGLLFWARHDIPPYSRFDMVPVVTLIDGCDTLSHVASSADEVTILGDLKQYLDRPEHRIIVQTMLKAGLMVGRGAIVIVRAIEAMKERRDYPDIDACRRALIESDKVAAALLTS